MAGAAEAEGGPKTTRGESGRGEKRSPQRGVSISEARSTKKVDFSLEGSSGDVPYWRR